MRPTSSNQVRLFLARRKTNLWRREEEKENPPLLHVKRKKIEEKGSSASNNEGKRGTENCLFLFLLSSPLWSDRN